MYANTIYGVLEYHSMYFLYYNKYKYININIMISKIFIARRSTGIISWINDLFTYESGR